MWCFNLVLEPPGDKSAPPRVNLKPKNSGLNSVKCSKLETSSLRPWLQGWQQRSLCGRMGQVYFLWQELLNYNCALRVQVVWSRHREDEGRLLHFQHRTREVSPISLDITIITIITIITTIISLIITISDGEFSGLRSVGTGLLTKGRFMTPKTIVW